MTNKEAIQAIKEHCYFANLVPIGKEALDMAIKALEERPKGKWEYTTHYARRYRVCPICKAEKEDDRAAGWNFCQYCGADMRGDV